VADRGHALAKLSLLVLVAGAAFLLQRYDAQRGEDFVYYYCAGLTLRTGSSPYDAGPYQACIADALGRANPHATKTAVSAYPPNAALLFSLLTLLPYQKAFILWSLLLLAATLLTAWRLSASPWSGDLTAESRLVLAAFFLTWPGLVFAWGYHKLTLLLFPLFLFAMPLSLGPRPLLGGLLLGGLGMQPHWFAGLAFFLALDRRWRAVGGAAAGLALSFLPLAFGMGVPGLVSGFLTSAREHSLWFLSLDSQSVLVGLYKPFLRYVPSPTPAFQAAQFVFPVVLVGGYWLWVRRRPGLPPLAPFLVVLLLAQPYSHASDTLWVLPACLVFFTAMSGGRKGEVWKPALGGLVFNASAALLLGGYPAAGLSARTLQFRAGYLTLAMVAVGALVYSTWKRRGGLVIRRQTPASE